MKMFWWIQNSIEKNYFLRSSDKRSIWTMGISTCRYSHPNNLWTRNNRNIPYFFIKNSVSHMSTQFGFHTPFFFFFFEYYFRFDWNNFFLCFVLFHPIVQMYGYMLCGIWWIQWWFVEEIITKRIKIDMSNVRTRKSLEKVESEQLDCRKLIEKRHNKAIG